MTDTAAVNPLNSNITVYEYYKNHHIRACKKIVQMTISMVEILMNSVILRIFEVFQVLQ